MISASNFDPPPVWAWRAPVRVRRVRCGDALALIDFYASLSQTSRRRRFLGFAQVGDGLARRMCGPDHRHAEGFIAEILGGDQDGSIVGHLCLEPTDEGAEEVAVAVSDDYQGQGIGRRLLEAGIDWARFRRVPFLTATAFADNVAILRLLLSVAPNAIVRQGGCGLVDVLVPLEPPRSLLEAAPRLGVTLI
jgi:GNAT superfamily N-acetyltransferase